MNATMPESEYQDVEELSVKLRGERKLNSDKNTRIAELEEQIGRMVDFVMAFGAWFDDTIRQEKSNEWNIKLGYDSIIVETLEDAQCKWNELKSEHLEQESDDDGN